MTHPTSIRLADTVKARLEAAASRRHQKPSTIAARLIDEGLRLAEHPGVGFHDSPAHGRVACLVSGPDVAEVIDVLSGLESTGDARVAETAEWFGLSPARVRVAIGYYAQFGEEIDREIELRRREAIELRMRQEAEQGLLG